MIQLAIQQGAEVDIIERLMHMSLKWDEENAKKSFFAALSEFKGKAKSIKKNKTAAFRTKDRSQQGGSRAMNMSYAYATLDQICAEIDPICAECGLSYYWANAQDRSTITVTCYLAHTSGHVISAHMSAAPDTSGLKNALQAVGSTLMYLRRYTLGLALGISVSEDTDTAEIPPNPAESRRDAVETPTKPTYTMADVEKNMPTWIKCVREQKKTPNQLLKMIESRYIVPPNVVLAIQGIK